MVKHLDKKTSVVKSRGGMNRKLPQKSDQYGGQISHLMEKLDRLVEFLEETFIHSNILENRLETKSIIEHLIASINLILQGDERELHAQFSRLVDRLKALEKDLINGSEEIVGLNQALQEKAEKCLQIQSSTGLIADEASFMRKLCGKLTTIYVEFCKLVEAYQTIDSDLAEQQDEIENEIDRTEAECRETDFEQEIYDAWGILIDVGQKIEKITRETLPEMKPIIEQDFREIQPTKIKFERIRTKVKLLTQKVERFNELVDVYRVIEAEDIRKKIEYLKENLMRYMSTFELVGEEGRFWGMVLGLHEIRAYNPVDLSNHTIELNPKNFQLDELEKFIATYDSAKASFAEFCQRSVDVKSYPTTINSKQDVAKKPDRKIVDADLAEIFVCALWGFIQEKTKPGHRVDRRRGDFGRRPQSVSKDLVGAGYLSFDNKTRIFRSSKEHPSVVSILADRRLIRISRNEKTNKVTRKKFIEEKVFLTDEGRLYAYLLTGSDLWQEFQNRTIADEVKKSIPNNQAFYTEAMESILEANRIRREEFMAKSQEIDKDE